jgi:hypothetical protein
MADHEQSYDEGRPRRLTALLRALAARIEELDREDGLLNAVPELLERLGDARTELFHYEVRCTYDTPQMRQSRRVVDDARRTRPSFLDDPEDDEPWRTSPLA